MRDCWPSLTLFLWRVQVTILKESQTESKSELWSKFYEISNTKGKLVISYLEIFCMVLWDMWGPCPIPTPLSRVPSIIFWTLFLSLSSLILHLSFSLSLSFPFSLVSHFHFSLISLFCRDQPNTTLAVLLRTLSKPSLPSHCLDESHENQKRRKNLKPSRPSLLCKL